MAFGYSGSNNAGQSKKPRKDSTKGSSASVHSHSSQSTGRSLNPFAKKETTPATTPSRSRTQSTSSATKSPVAVNKSPAKSADTDQRSKDVFEFLEEEEEDESEGSGSEQTSSGSETDEDDADVQPKTTPFTPATIGLQLARGPPVLQQPGSYNEPSATKKDVSSPVQEKRELDFSAMPESLYSQRNPAPLQRPSFPPSPPKSPEETHSKKAPKMRKTHNTKPKKIASGYGYLAPRIKVSKGDGGKDRLPPLYRQFEHLNHRVLLHLQDEIALMEEDLHTLDELEEGYRAAEREKSKPQLASRRLEAQAQSYSTLHARRQNLMELLIQKTEQYSEYFQCTPPSPAQPSQTLRLTNKKLQDNALFAYTRVIQTLPRASDSDIKTYRTWMKDRKPITAAETRFLDHDQDLVSITPFLPSSTAGPSKPSSPSIFPAIVIASTAILLPLLAFSMVSEFTGRLVLVAIVGGAASVVAGHHSTGTEQFVDPRDGWRCAMGYVLFFLLILLNSRGWIYADLLMQLLWVYDYGCYVYPLVSPVVLCFLLVLFFVFF